MFRAYDATRERLVAVKLFKLDLPPERGHQLVAEFERLIAAELAHPAMAAPLATGISGVSAFLAQDYVAADSLDSVVREYGPAPAGNALRVATQLAGALDFAAAVYVTHGALHPRDVLLSSDETRLTGLGVARALERIGVVAPVRRPYTAPERIAGAEWDRRADIFSLAALTHELLWGRRISGVGAQVADSLTAVEGADLHALKTVFACALAELPADRYATALEFAEALRMACPDVAVAPEPAAPKRRGGREVEPRLPLDGEPEQSSVVSRQSSVVSRQSSVDSHQSSVVSHQSSVVSHQSSGGSDLSSVLGQQPSVASDPVRAESADVSSVEPAPPAGVALPASGATAAGEARRDTPKREKRRVAKPIEPDAPRFSPEDTAPIVRTSADAAAIAQGFSPADLDLASPIDRPEIVYEPPVPDIRLESAPLDRAAIDRPTAVPAGLITGHDPDVLSALEVTRTAVWPLVLALGVGIAIGFAGGFFTGTRDRTDPPPAAAAGREFTEAAVPPAPTSPAPTSDVQGQKPDAEVAKAETPKPAAPAKSETGTVKPAAAPPAAEGRLLIRSRPAGARVSVDGKDRGVTPATIHDLARGAHRLKITQDGYRADERRIVITASRPALSMTVALVRARGVAPAAAAARSTPAASAPAFAGPLSVESRPPGARVFIDGKLVGTTPMSLPSVAAGSHAIRLEHEGYRRWSSSVRVVASEQNRVTASLER